MTESVTMRQNLHAKRTRHGEEHSASLKSGFVMGTQIVLMELMKTLHYIAAQHLSHALPICSHVETEDVSTM